MQYSITKKSGEPAYLQLYRLLRDDIIGLPLLLRPSDCIFCCTSRFFCPGICNLRIPVVHLIQETDL